MNYSPLFHTLHDEQSPVGSIGRGAHYSVLTMPQWFNVDKELFINGEARIQRFAVIWDEDHDTRLIKALELAHLRGLLYPIKYIGERKGYLTILLDAAYIARHEKELQRYLTSWRQVLEDSIDDYWEVEIASEWDPSGLIATNESVLKTYLKNIDNLWDIGLQLPTISQKLRTAMLKPTTAADGRKPLVGQVPAECQPWPIK